MIAESGRRRPKQLPVGAGADAARTAKARAAQPPAPGEPFGDLWEEIARLRGVIRQVSERAAGVETMPELLHLLDGLGRASVRLAHLLRTQRALDEEQTAAALSRALDAVIKKRQ